MVACADLDGMGGDPGCVFTAVESIVGVPDTLCCGIELESILLIDIGVGVAFGELRFLYQLLAAETESKSDSESGVGDRDGLAVRLIVRGIRVKVAGDPRTVTVVSDVLLVERDSGVAFTRADVTDNVLEILLVLDIPERTLFSEGATADIDSRCTRVDVTDGAGREDMAMWKCVDSEGLRVDLTTFG